MKSTNNGLLRKLNAIADQVRLQTVHSDDYSQKQDLRGSPSKTSAIPFVRSYPRVGLLLLKNNELTWITTNNSGGMRGAAKGDLFSWKIRPEGRLFFFILILLHC